jgi:hypothetical protein
LFWFVLIRFVLCCLLVCLIDLLFKQSNKQ